MVRPCVLYNKRALQIAAALDATCDHLDRVCTFDRLAGWTEQNQASKGAPTWVLDKDFQGSEAVRLQRNREVVIRTLALNGDPLKHPRGEAMKFVDPLFRVNRDFVYRSVMVNGLALKHVPDEYKDDRPLVLAAVGQNGMALEYASADLKDDCEVCCYAVAQTEKAMAHVGPLQKDCYEVILAADKTGALRDDRKWMLQALQEEPHLLQYASKRLLMDYEVVTSACHEDGLCLAYASKTLKADTRVVRIAVEQNGLALEYAGTTMQNSINILSIALRQNGMALQFASENLKADKRVVLRALQFNGLALQFASEGIRRDKGAVIRALKQNPKAWKFAHNSLRRDPEFSTKRLQKLLALEFEIQDPPDEDEPDQNAVPEPDLRQFSWASEVPIRMPAHPPNGALVPTWVMSMLASNNSPNTTFQSTGANSLGVNFNSTGSPGRGNFSPAATWHSSGSPRLPQSPAAKLPTSLPQSPATKLPTVQRSFSSPAFQRPRSPADIHIPS